MKRIKRKLRSSLQYYWKIMTGSFFSLTDHFIPYWLDINLFVLVLLMHGWSSSLWLCRLMTFKEYNFYWLNIYWNKFSIFYNVFDCLIFGTYKIPGSSLGPSANGMLVSLQPMHSLTLLLNKPLWEEHSFFKCKRCRTGFLHLLLIRCPAMPVKMTSYILKECLNTVVCYDQGVSYCPLDNDLCFPNHCKHSCAKMKIKHHI